MKKGTKILFFALGIFAVLIGCSTKKDTFINRSSHAMVSKYNVLYNGNLAFDEAKDKLDAEYEDNFWEILPIEAINIEDSNKNCLPSSP